MSMQEEKRLDDSISFTDLLSRIFSLIECSKRTSDSKSDRNPDTKSVRYISSILVSLPWDSLSSLTKLMSPFESRRVLCSSYDRFCVQNRHFFTPSLLY